MSKSKEKKQFPTSEDFQNKWPELFRDVSCRFSLPIGWSPLVWNLCEMITWNLKHAKPKPNPKVVQVKEKFGCLRIHCVDMNETIEAFITFAETMSSTICDTCGTNQNVSTGGKGWINTKCESCRKEWGEIREKRFQETS